MGVPAEEVTRDASKARACLEDIVLILRHDTEDIYLSGEGELAACSNLIDEIEVLLNGREKK